MHYAKMGRVEQQKNQMRGAGAKGAQHYHRLQKSQPKKRINSAQPGMRRELDKLSQKLNEEQR